MDTKALRQKILDLAIRGKLVPQDPNDEPASVLLERIREQKKQMVKEGKLKAKDIKNDSVIFVGEDSLHYEKFSDGSVKCIEEEIPFELPEGWAWARLGTVTETIGDGDHQPPPQTSSGVPFLVISNVSGGKLSFENTRFVGEEYFSQLSETRKPRNGDLLFTVTGSYGIPVLVDTDDKFCFQRHIAIVRPCIISNRYFHIVLGSSYVKSICDDKATGTAQKTVGLATLRELLIPVAPHKEQMQIYAQAQDALSIVDSISSNKEDLLNIIENTKSKILDLAIRGQLVPQDPNDEPASVLLERIRSEKEALIKAGKIKRDKKESVIFKGEDNSYYLNNSEIIEMKFDIPDSWIWFAHNELFEISGGSQPPKSRFSDTPKPHFIRLFQIRDYGTSPVPVYIPEEFATKQTRKGDILLARYGASLGKVFWAEDGAYNVAMAKIEFKFKEGILPEYMYYFYNSSIYRDCIFSISRTAQAGFNKEDLNMLFVPLPPVEEQQRIVNCINNFYKIIDHLIAIIN